MLTREQIAMMTAVTALLTVFVGGVGWAITAGDNYQTPADADANDDTCEGSGVEVTPSDDGDGLRFDETCEEPEEPVEEPDQDSEESPPPEKDNGAGVRV
jgi:hypothetical protein